MKQIQSQGQTLGFHTYAVPRVGKSRDRKDSTGGGQAGRKALLSNDYRLSAGDDEKVWGKESRDR